MPVYLIAHTTVACPGLFLVFQSLKSLFSQAPLSNHFLVFIPGFLFLLNTHTGLSSLLAQFQAQG